MSVPPPPYNSTCAFREHLPHIVHGGVAARDDHVRAVAELARQTSQFRDGSRQLRVLHRAGCVDQKTRPRPRLVEAGHDELAVAGLPAMRPPVGAVVSAERAVAQGSAHGVTDGRHVVDLRRERRAGPAPPAREGRRRRRCESLLDAPRHLAPHELGLDPVDTRDAALAAIVGRQLPESPLAVRARPAVLPGRRSLRRVVGPRRRRQLLVVDLGALATLQSILAGQRRIARQRQSFRVEIVVDFAVAGRVPASVVPDARGLLAPLVVAQQMADLVNQQARVLLDACARRPRRRCSTAASGNRRPCCRSDRSRRERG